MRITLGIILTVIVVHTTTQVHAQTPLQRRWEREQAIEAQREYIRLQNELAREQLEAMQRRQLYLHAYVQCMRNVYPTAEDFQLQELECQRQAMEWGTP